MYSIYSGNDKGTRKTLKLQITYVQKVPSHYFQYFVLLILFKTHSLFPYQLIYVSSRKVNFHILYYQFYYMQTYIHNYAILGVQRKEKNIRPIVSRTPWNSLADPSLDNTASLEAQWFPTFSGLRHPWQAFQKFPAPL